MKELIGKIVESLLVGEREQELQFVTDAGLMTYRTYGDCCSETWFADILGVDALLGGTVATAEEIELPDADPNDGRTRQESDCFYGVKLATDKGTVTIVYRNSSNGYYGGNIDFIEAAAPLKDAKEITADWQASQPVTD